MVCVQVVQALLVRAWLFMLERPENYSLHAGGVVLVLIIVAVTAVSGFDPVARK